MKNPLKHCEVTLEALPEDTSVRGNLIDSGDPEQDKADEDTVIERLKSGDIAAWFVAKVTVSLKGFKGTDYLGCCSYESLEEFKRGDYYDDMVHEAYHRMLDSIDSAKKRLQEIEGLV